MPENGQSELETCSILNQITQYSHLVKNVLGKKLFSAKIVLCKLCYMHYWVGIDKNHTKDMG